ncbi:MAG: diguanylate cyclase [Gammaproteobacteria bacterium]|nr:diguanylate cyclase [Gammaproteobacteria bacterium]
MPAVLAIVSLLLAHSNWRAYDAARDEVFHAEADMVRLADSVAAFQQMLLDRTTQQLRILGGISLSGNNNSTACDKFLARQLEIFPSFDNLAFADANGTVTCSARSNTIPLPTLLPGASSPDKPLLLSLGSDELAIVLPRKSIQGRAQGWVIAVLPVAAFFQANSQTAVFALVHDGGLVAAYPAKNAQDSRNPLFIKFMRALRPPMATPLAILDGTDWLYAAQVKGSAKELWLLVRLPTDAATGQIMRMAALMAMALSLAGLSLWVLCSQSSAYLVAINWRRFDLAMKVEHAIATLRERLRQMQWNKAQRSKGSNTELHVAYQKLKHSFADEAERMRQITLLDELSQALQGCINSAELTEQIAHSAVALFPGSSGALLLNATSGVVELHHAWGGSTHQEVFPPQDCWALRIGHPYHAQQAGAVSCAHLREKHADYICLPLIANSEILGVLHLSRLGGNTIESGIPWAAESIAERTAIAISVIRRAEQLQIRATRDALTGIYNRRFMEEALAIEQSRAERRGSPIGLMMVDVDYFKRFNDTFGHDAGDAVLRGIGQLLRRTMREGDMPCRYGGEEFAVILPGADLAQTHQRAEAIRTAIERWEPQHEGHSFGQVTVSIGIAALPLNGNSWQAALKVADEALYAAKRGGRNQVASPA